MMSGIIAPRRITRSPTASYDRSKLRACASADVKECWLVLGPEKLIEVHRFLPSPFTR